MPYVMLRCPMCKMVCAHESHGVARDKDGRMHQEHRCVKCQTITNVFMNDDGSDFQENVDLPDTTDIENRQE